MLSHVVLLLYRAFLSCLCYNLGIVYCVRLFFFFFKSWLFPVEKQVNCFCAVSVKAACSEVCTQTLPRLKQGLFFFFSPSSIFLSNFKPAFLNNNLLPVFPLCAHVENMSCLQWPFRRAFDHVLRQAELWEKLRFTEYVVPGGPVDVKVFLRDTDLGGE